MSYYNFTAKYVLRSGGNDKYQAVFLEYANIAIPDMILNHIYLFSADSREVYISKIAYMRLTQRFEEFITYLRPIKGISRNCITIDHINMMMKHLEATVPDTVPTYKKDNGSGEIIHALRCRNTGVKLVSFGGNSSMKIYNSQQRAHIHEEVERYNEIKKKYPLLDSGEIFAKMSAQYKKYNQPDISEYHKIKWSLPANWGYDTIGMCAQFADLYKKYPARKAFGKIFDLYHGDDKDLDLAAEIANDEIQITNKINENMNLNLPIPEYYFANHHLVRNGKVIKLRNGILINGSETYEGINVRPDSEEFNIVE